MGVFLGLQIRYILKPIMAVPLDNQRWDSPGSAVFNMNLGNHLILHSIHFSSIKTRLMTLAVEDVGDE